MRTLFLVLFLFYSFSLTNNIALSQQLGDKSDASYHEILKASEEEVAEKKRTAIASEALDSSTQWQIFKVQNAIRVFTFHHSASVIIFWVVIFIVFFGLSLTWREVTKHEDYQPIRSKKEEKPEEEKPKEEEYHSVEITKQGIKIKSNVIGLLILVVSLGFFYLYLHYVYPIHYK